MLLYRADGDPPWFGHASWWTPDPDHAARYTHMHGFGGPVVYVAEVDPVSPLRLGQDPWSLLEALGFDREDFGASMLDHEIVWSLSGPLAGLGHDWAVLPVEHPDGWFDEWLYLGETPIRPRQA
jgi:hypothetical protein